MVVQIILNNSFYRLKKNPPLPVIEVRPLINFQQAPFLLFELFRCCFFKILIFYRVQTCSNYKQRGSINNEFSSRRKWIGSRLEQIHLLFLFGPFNNNNQHLVNQTQKVETRIVTASKNNSSLNWNVEQQSHVEHKNTCWAKVCYDLLLKYTNRLTKLKKLGDNAPQQ